MVLVELAGVLLYRRRDEPASHLLGMQFVVLTGCAWKRAGPRSVSCAGTLGAIADYAKSRVLWAVWVCAGTGQNRSGY